MFMRSNHTSGILITLDISRSITSYNDSLFVIIADHTSDSRGIGT